MRRAGSGSSARLTRVALPLAVFLTVFVVHVRSPVMTSYDSRWSIFTAMSMIRGGDTDLDEYGLLVEEARFYGVERRGGHLYDVYPIGPALLALPFVLVADHVCRWACDGDLDDQLRSRPGIHERLERLVASVLVAATALLVYLIGRLALDRAPPACLLAGIFAFATSAWSTASRALWQHGPSMLMLTLALYLVLLARRRPTLIPLAALPLALAYVMRPTNALSVAFLTVYVLRRHRPWAFRYLLGGSLVTVPFLVFNLAVHGAPLPPYYRAAAAGLGPTQDFLEALAGTLVSPARGLFVFSPVLLFAIPGAVARLRAPRRDELDVWLVLIVVLHWVTISTFRSWWGGHSYGPRLFTDVAPYLVYFLVPVVGSLWPPQGLRRSAVTGLFLAALAVSVLIHARGAVSRHGYAWNGSPVDVDQATARLWDWRDPPFGRNVWKPSLP